MTKEDVLSWLFRCAREYDNNLVNRHLLFIYDNRGRTDIIEVSFLPGHFLHMTGVKFAEGAEIRATDFYDRCLNQRLSINDFKMARDGTTDLKMQVFPYLVKRDLSARMIGEFGERRPALYTEKILGSVNHGCVGLIRTNGTNIFVPNTVLREDIRDITVRPQQRILLILSKKALERVYSVIAYKAKGVEVNENLFPATLRRRVNFDI